MFGSMGIPTGFALSMPSRFSIDSIYRHCDMDIVLSVIVILMPTIFDGLPRSVTSHSACKLFLIDSSIPSVVANNNRSSTHTVMMANSPPTYWMYVHGSDLNCEYPCHCQDL